VRGQDRAKARLRGIKPLRQGRGLCHSVVASTAGKGDKTQVADRAKSSDPRKRRRARRASRSKLTREQIEEMFARFQALDPEPQTELKFRDPFTLLVAVVLSAQATDTSVNHATPALFAAADTPEKMASLDEEEVSKRIKTIGLFRNKAKNVVALSRKIVAEYDGLVPDRREDLEGLPGVGRKTANVVLNVAFGQPTIAIDTHIFRVSNRTGLAPGKTPLEVEETLERVIPDQYKLHAHHWLILHGRYICKARKPECWRCHVSDLCAFKEKVAAPT
jgi:endonuclease-3